MEHRVGICVSLEISSVCIVETRGRIVKETSSATEPEVLVDLVNSSTRSVCEKAAKGHERHD